MTNQNNAVMIIQLCEKFEDIYKGNGCLDLALAKEIVSILPSIYREEYLFRIRFDDSFRYGLVNASNKDVEFEPLKNFVIILSNHLVKRSWVFSQLFCFHVLTDLRGCSLLEIGGCLSESLLNLFSVAKYIGTGLDDAVSQRESEHSALYNNPNFSFVKCDIQDDNCHQLLSKADRIFSTACLEHIHDIPKTLDNCYSLCNAGGFLYAYIAPIYSHLRAGQHGYIDKKSIPNLDDAVGLHLIPVEEQFRRLNRMGFTDSKSREILTGLYFNRDINHKYFEEYYLSLTNSPFFPIRIETMEDYSITHRFPKEFKEVRKMNKRAINVTALGIRALIYKK